MICDCEVYEICPSCAPSEPTYAKAAAANDEAARRRVEPSPSYTLKEIEALAWEFIDERSDSFDEAIKYRLSMSIFIQWLARREREGEGRDASD